LYTLIERRSFNAAKTHSGHTALTFDRVLQTATRSRRELDTDCRKATLAIHRFYGGTEALHNKTFKMPDFEVVN